MGSVPARGVWGILVALFALVVLAAGCAQPKTEPAQPSGGTPAASTGASQAPAKPAAPKSPVSVTIAYSAAVDNVDPHLGRSLGALGISFYIHDTLWEYKEGGKDPTPRLATGWKFDPTGTELTINLRKNVRFQDGTPFNATAVKFNFDRLSSRTTRVRQSGGLDQFVQETRVIDDSTVLLKLERPYAALLRIMSTPARGMISPKAYAAATKDYGNQVAVGTGPYKLKEIVQGDRVVLERNPDFWGDAPKIDQITFKMVAEASTRVLMMEAGDAQVADKIPPTDVARLQKLPRVSIENTPSDRIYYIALMTEKEDGSGPLPFADKNVRMAVNYAVNREELIKLFAGYGSVANSNFSPNVFGYKSTKTFAYDPAKARQLLAQAGYPNGFSTTLWTTTGYYPLDKAVNEAVQAQLAQVGINVKLVPMELASYLELIQVPQGKSRVPRDMIFRSFSTQATGEPGILQILIKDGWPPKQWNVSFYHNPKVDDLHFRALDTYDPDRRAALYQELQKEVMEDAPWLFLYYLDDLTAFAKSMKGQLMYPDLIDIRSAQLE